MDKGLRLPPIFSTKFAVTHPEIRVKNDNEFLWTIKEPHEYNSEVVNMDKRRI